jgi:hypothetical protein
MISFGGTPAERTSDGVLMLYDGNVFALALKETGESISLPAFFNRLRRRRDP